MTKRNIGKFIKKYRKERKLTQDARHEKVWCFDSPCFKRS